GVRSAIEQSLFARQYLFFRSEHFPRFTSEFRRDIRQFLFQRRTRAAQGCAHALVNGALCHGVEWLRRERRVIPPRRECEMQLAGPLAQQLYFFRIYTAYQFLEKSTGQRCFTLKIAFTLQHALVVAAEGVHSKRPDVAFIGDRALQETNNRWVRLWPGIFEVSHESWHVWKISFLRQESRDFHVRVHAVLEFPIEFQEKFIIKEH